MAKTKAPTQNRAFTVVLGREEGKKRAGRIKGRNDIAYGVVIVRSGKKTETSPGIKTGQEALKRAKTKLLRPGVKLKVRKGAALYRADPDNPRGLIREVDGRLERGIFEGKDFKAYI